MSFPSDHAQPQAQGAQPGFTPLDQSKDKKIVPQQLFRAQPPPDPIGTNRPQAHKVGSVTPTQYNRDPYAVSKDEMLRQVPQSSEVPEWSTYSPQGRSGSNRSGSSGRHRSADGASRNERKPTGSSTSDAKDRLDRDSDFHKIWSYSSESSDRTASRPGSGSMSRLSRPRSSSDQSRRKKEAGDVLPQRSGSIGRRKDSPGRRSGNQQPTEKEEAQFALYSKLMNLAGNRGVPDKLLHKMDQNGELRHHIPLDADGQVTSLGSIPHLKEPAGADCRPCAFLFKGRCLKSELCLYCHFKHPERKPKRLRPSKNTRMRRARLMQNYLQGTDGDQGANECESDADVSSSRRQGASSSLGNEEAIMGADNSSSASADVLSRLSKLDLGKDEGQKCVGKRISL